MSFRRHMPIILLALWLALDGTLALIGWVGEQHFLLFGVVMLLCGQFIVGSGWVAFGEHGIKTTIAAVLGGLLLGGLFTCGGPILLVRLVVLLIHGDKTAGTMAIVLLFTVVAIAITWTLGAVILNLPLIVARTCGWRFCFDPKPQADSIRPYQISIRENFLYTTVVAVFAAIWSGTELLGATRPQDSICFYIVPLLIPWSIWAIFCWVRPIHAGLVAIVVACMWSVIVLRVMGGPLGPLHAALFVLIPSGVMIIHMLVLQAGGFRWRRHLVVELPPPQRIDEPVSDHEN